MKKSILFFSVVMLAVLTGCAKKQLSIGEYRISEDGRRDFIVAYEDLVFMQIKSPENASGSLKYWNWAGKYSIEDSGEILFDMDRETLKRWRFYFSFLQKRGGIVLNDLSNNRGYLLKYQIPKKRAGARPGFIPTGSTGTDHNYTPLPRQE